MASRGCNEGDDVLGDPKRFAYDLGRAGIGPMESEPLIEKAYGEGVLSRPAIYRLTKAGKERTPYMDVLKVLLKCMLKIQPKNFTQIDDK